MSLNHLEIMVERVSFFVFDDNGIILYRKCFFVPLRFNRLDKCRKEKVVFE